jgi:hypothetical protein
MILCCSVIFRDYAFWLFLCYDGDVLSTLHCLVYKLAVVVIPVLVFILISSNIPFTSSISSSDPLPYIAPFSAAPPRKYVIDRDETFDFRLLNMHLAALDPLDACLDLGDDMKIRKDIECNDNELGGIPATGK